ncbi:MAG: CRISPR-associated endonuclease Cas3'' [Myxococcaceae bacterium]|nr:CRISPR-associated endonuclease Cas3'' [Myxococcaceae bacterium]MCA3011610.1 CRISPR-associated endonuclease Cas3'' [Myxococcaceae bacterium]
MLRIPTGFGKTAGTVVAWLHHRVVKQNKTWPTRLVFCLPMRVLVEQTSGTIRTWLQRAGLAERVRLHVLMGGVEAGDWLETPEQPAIIVGTQDMLVSRALMRGYGSSRGKWPMEFALLNNDALWVLDEIQLMGVALATTTQLAAFRSRRGISRPVHHWWMSATLQTNWLGSVDFRSEADALATNVLDIPATERRGGLFGVTRHLARQEDAGVEAVANLVRTRHRPRTLTLVVVNTVDRAVELAGALSGPGKGRRAAAEPTRPDLRLVHSRFRGQEREAWATTFLGRRHGADLAEAGRIIVATQVVEAGVDLSASLLVTDLAPWPSLVQRFGRCARYADETGDVIVVGTPPERAADAAPYEVGELHAASVALDQLGPLAGPAELLRFEDALTPELRRSLYPYAPTHVLREKDLNDLFDTTADLAGADLDVGRFVREGDERDVSVFWRDVAPDNRDPAEPFPSRAELCPAPLYGKRGIEEALKERTGWMYDYLDERWRVTRRAPPGAVVMLSSRQGGYSSTGWDPRSKASVEVVVVPAAPRAQLVERATSGQGDDALSEARWQSIAEHGGDVGREVTRLATAVGLEPRLVTVLELAGRWHDAGKAHPVFQAAILPAARQRSDAPLATDWAKAPGDAWQRGGHRARPGFRHELVSTLMLLDLLHRTHPGHPASVGGVAAVLNAIGVVPAAPAEEWTGRLANELAALSADEFNLVAYVVCAHHGKVRMQWAPSPMDREGRGRILGVEEGDVVPAVNLAVDGTVELLPSVELHLDGASLGPSSRHGAPWADRVEGLLRARGPFQLAFIETLLRAADWVASARGEVHS